MQQGPPERVATETPPLQSRPPVQQRPPVATETPRATCGRRCLASTILRSRRPHQPMRLQPAQLQRTVRVCASPPPPPPPSHTARPILLHSEARSAQAHGPSPGRHTPTHAPSSNPHHHRHPRPLRAPVAHSTVIVSRTIVLQGGSTRPSPAAHAPGHARTGARDPITRHRPLRSHVAALGAGDHHAQSSWGFGQTDSQDRAVRLGRTVVPSVLHMREASHAHVTAGPGRQTGAGEPDLAR